MRTQGALGAVVLSLALLAPTPAALADAGAGRQARTAAGRVAAAPGGRERDANVAAVQPGRRAARRQTKALSNVERRELARRAVEDRVREWMPENQVLEVRTAVTEQGRSHNPITGDGLVRVYTHQRLNEGATRWQRVRHYFSRFRKQQFTVNVSPTGHEVRVLSMESLAPQRRVANAIDHAIPVRQVVRDLIASRGATEGAVTASAALTMFTHTMMTASNDSASATAGMAVGVGALLQRALSVTVGGVRRRHEARTEALMTTIDWARGLGENGNYPTLSDTYQHYVHVLARDKPGTTPSTIERFAEQLRGAW
jgi:hypothetical protein